MRHRANGVLPVVALAVLIAGCASSASPAPTTPPAASLTPSPTLSPSSATRLPVPVGTWVGTGEPMAGSTIPWSYTATLRECAVGEPCGEWEYATTKETGEQISCGGTLRSVGMDSSASVLEVDAYFVLREQVTWKRGPWEGCHDADMYLAPLPDGAAYAAVAAAGSTSVRAASARSGACDSLRPLAPERSERPSAVATMTA